MNYLGNFFLLVLSQCATAHNIIGENEKLTPDHTCDFQQDTVWYSTSSFDMGDSALIKA